MSRQPSPEATTPPPGLASSYPLRWAAAVVMLAGILMDLIDVTIVNVAVPSIRSGLHASGAQVEWVISAYMLAFAAVLITAGSLGDLLGRKRLFLTGMALFAVASLGAGVSHTPDELIIARVVQGAAAGVMTPQLLATFRTMFDGADLGKAFGLYGMAGGFATAIGLVAGGALTSANLFGWHWRTVFLINVPIALVTFAAGMRFIPETRARSGRKPDLAGPAALVVALVAIIYPVLEGRQNGWPTWGWMVLAGGLALLAALLVFEARVHRDGVAPLIQVEIFRSVAFSAGQAVQLAFSAGLQAFFLIFALWVQVGQHYSPLRAGLTTVAFSVGAFFLAAMAIPLAKRYGRLVLVGGGIVMGTGCVGVAVGAHHVGHTTNPWPLVPGLAVAGIGLSLLVIPLANVVLAAVPRDIAGGASGIFSTVQQVGGVMGVAALGSIFFSYAQPHGYRAAFIHTIPYVTGIFLVAAAIALILPKTALGDAEALEIT